MGERLGPFIPAFYDIGIKHYVAGFSATPPRIHQLILGAVTLEPNRILGSFRMLWGGIPVGGWLLGLGISEMASGRSNPLDFFRILKSSSLGEINLLLEQAWA